MKNSNSPFSIPHSPFSRYPQYKDSGVDWLGQVPAHWEVKRVGYFFTERREKVSDRDFPPLSVTKNGIVPQLETAAKTDDNDNRKKVCRGDFVINSRSDRNGSSGASDLDGSVSLINTVLRPLDAVHTPFIHHLLRSHPFQQEYYRNGQGIVADLWTTNYSAMRDIRLGMPPLAEQREIAGFLDRETGKIDALVAEQERLLELLKEKRQAVISHAVTRGLNPNAPLKPSGLPWLGDVPVHWEVKQLRHLITKIEQGSSPQCESDPAESDQWGVLKVGCVNGAAFDLREQKALPAGVLPEKQYAVCEGDILMSRGNTLELVGQAAVVPDGCGNLLLSDLLYRFRPLEDAAVAKYLVAVLRSALGRLQIERDATGTSPSMKKIGQGNIREFVIALPPLAEQRAIVAHLDAATAQFDALTAEVERALALLQERRTALISAAVTGQIDVRSAALQAAV